MSGFTDINLHQSGHGHNSNSPTSTTSNNSIENSNSNSSINKLTHVASLRSNSGSRSPLGIANIINSQSAQSNQMNDSLPPVSTKSSSPSIHPEGLGKVLNKGQGQKLPRISSLTSGYSQPSIPLQFSNITHPKLESRGNHHPSTVEDTKQRLNICNLLSDAPSTSSFGPMQSTLPPPIISSPFVQSSRSISPPGLGPPQFITQAYQPQIQQPIKPTQFINSSVMAIGRQKPGPKPGARSRNSSSSVSFSVTPPGPISSSSMSNLNPNAGLSPNINPISNQITHHYTPFVYPQQRSRATPALAVNLIKSKVNIAENYMILPSSNTNANNTNGNNNEVGGPQTHSIMNSKLEQVPIFRPTNEEFLDPVGFITKIRDIGEKFGMVKIIPPTDWNPNFGIDTEVSFFSFFFYDIYMIYLY